MCVIWQKRALVPWHGPIVNVPGHLATFDPGSPPLPPLSCWLGPPIRRPPTSRRPSPSSTAPAPRGCGGERCASGRDAWPLPHVRHNAVFCRLCSSCVLLYHPASFCSACLLLLHRSGPWPMVRTPAPPDAARIMFFSRL